MVANSNGRVLAALTIRRSENEASFDLARLEGHPTSLS